MAGHEIYELGDMFGIVDFGVAIILFEGGLNLEWSRLKRQEAAIRRLITWGALVTLVGAAALAGLVLGWHWDLAILFGALVVVTGPTVIQPLLRDMRLRPRLKTILEAEGVLIDPIGALLAGFILQLVLVMVPSATTLASQTADVLISTFRVTVSIGFGVLAHRTRKRRRTSLPPSIKRWGVLAKIPSLQNSPPHNFLFTSEQRRNISRVVRLFVICTIFFRCTSH